MSFFLFLLDEAVKSQIQAAKKKAPNSRRANPKQ